MLAKSSIVGPSLQLAPLLVVLFCVFISASPTKEPLKRFADHSLEPRYHRLPASVKPTGYNINLDLTGVFKQPSYSGTVVIDVKFFGLTRPRFSKRKPFITYTSVVADKETPIVAHEADEIVMHADEAVQIDEVEVIDMESGSPMLIEATGRDVKNQLIVLKMAKDLPKNGHRGQIRLTFRTNVRYDNHGLYFSTDSSNAHKYRHVVAKFQPTFARLALPCFDEPGLKAQFRLSFKHPAEMQAYATTERKTLNKIGDSFVESVFEETPVMPIHMVAFVVGDFDPNPLVRQPRSDLTLRFLSVPGSANKGHHALEVAEKALLDFESYIGHPFPLKKLDVVAISDTDTDNTETWGLVFIRDYLAVNDKETQEFSGISTAVNVAHVVVHQWFANLVTARWWDDLWITESVAAQKAFELVAKLYPEYDSDYYVRIGTLSKILASDQSGRKHSLSPPEDKLAQSAQIYEIFDTLTFMKSGAVARMIQDMIGEAHFKLALRKLVHDFAYGNIVFDDLKMCIEATSSSSSSFTKETMKQIDQTLRSFSKVSGYPVVNVDLGSVGTENGYVVAHLEPFQLASQPTTASQGITLKETGYKKTSGDKTATIVTNWHDWRMPLSVYVSDASSKQSEYVPMKFSSTEPRAYAKLPDWFNQDTDYLKLVPGPQLEPDISTYYRIRYSERLLRQLKNPIEQQQLGTIDRLQILDDANALVGSKLIEGNVFRDLFDWHKNENDFVMIVEMVTANKTLSTLDVGNGQPSDSLQVFQRVFVDYGFEARGDESLSEQRARSITLRALVDEGNERVIGAAIKAFDEDPDNVAPFLRDPIYVAVVKEGEQDRVQRLVEHLHETSSYEERLRLASALALTQDKQVLGDLVEFLNKRSGFKLAALQQLVKLQPMFSFGPDGYGGSKIVMSQ
uniref:Aminopeptidase n=1 Tax=Aceria tosichella TaxID=561515 RepID=A0A6G1SKX5_9ACAR